MTFHWGEIKLVLGHFLLPFSWFYHIVGVVEIPVLLYVHDFSDSVHVHNIYLCMSIFIKVAFWYIYFAHFNFWLSHLDGWNC